MTEPISDALFGVDGTELPPLSPDPSGHGRWQDAQALPSLPLPPIPDLNTTRDAIAAMLDQGPGGPVNADATAAPAAAPASATTPPAVPAVPEAGPASSAGAPRPIIAPTISPAAPGRGVVGPRYSPPLVARSFPRVHLRDSRRRLGRLSHALPTRSRSNGGAGAFFVVLLITIAVLLYFIIDGLVASFASLFRLLP